MESEQHHRHHQLTLRTHVPRAGFVWAPRASVLVQERHDRAVLNALRDQGGATLLEAGARGSVRQAQRQVERALVGMFDMAAADAEAGRIDELETPLDWVADLRTRLQWAGLLEEDIFLELFLRLCSARREWHANPREPFNTKEHGVLAHAIDDFHQAASDGWAAPHDGLFMGALPLVGGTGEEEERAGDDPATAASHTQGTGAFAAAGEPHPRTYSSSGGAREERDEDGDVQMDDGEGEEAEVREVRQRLADTSLGEDMEVEE